MKKYLKFIIPIAVILIIVLAWMFWPAKKQKVEQTQPTRKLEQINKIDIKDRPYVTLVPRADGREVTLTIDNVLNATDVEYELEYQAESLIQGVFGTIDFNKEPAPVSKDLLFGSCSKGKCKYDEGVTGGNLVLRFDGGTEPFVLKSDFNLQNMFDRQGVFTSQDIKAELDVGKTGLASATYMIIMNTMGLPAELEGDIIAGPYGFFTTGSSKLAKATITIKSKDDLTGAKLYQWTGTSWQELKPEIGEAGLTAPVTSLGTFVVVK